MEVTTRLEEFLSWFQSNGGFFDKSVMDFTVFPTSEGGRGLVARRSIPKGHVLFTIPRHLTLSTRTSSLPELFGFENWKSMKLSEDWSGLILCMLWESANPTSKWSSYFDILPSEFDTPMFWNDDDLTELEGTTLVDKIGRAQAEQSYNDKVLPSIKSRSDLFPPEKITSHFSLEVYHLMGSRILSRSFSVERWDSEEEIPASRPSDSSEEDTTTEPNFQGGAEEHSQEVEIKEEDEEDGSSDIAMVPMADMLNARYGSENAKLFHEERELKMISTKPVKAGEQIWNTYGDLPNEELLRRYGHVDLLPLPGGEEGNPGDVVEIRADIIVSAVGKHYPSVTSASSKDRIDWWLDEGGDDVFLLEHDLELPPVLTAFIRLLIMDTTEWTKTRDKGKPPKPKVDLEILSILRDVLQSRAQQFKTNVEHDEELLSSSERFLSQRRRNAIIVRLGEKRILHRTITKVEDMIHEGSGHNKRKVGNVESPLERKKMRR